MSSSLGKGRLVDQHHPRSGQCIGIVLHAAIYGTMTDFAFFPPSRSPIKFFERVLPNLVFDPARFGRETRRCTGTQHWMRSLNKLLIVIGLMERDKF